MYQKMLHQKNIFSGDLDGYFLEKHFFGIIFLSVDFFLNNFLRSEISIKFWIFFIPTETYFGEQNFAPRRNFLNFLTQKYEIPITKSGNKKNTYFVFLS
jgi:hypothetical protein